jgi:hypothetical protein
VFCNEILHEALSSFVPRLPFCTCLPLEAFTRLCSSRPAGSKSDSKDCASRTLYHKRPSATGSCSGHSTIRLTTYFSKTHFRNVLLHTSQSPRPFLSLRSFKIFCISCFPFVEVQSLSWTSSDHFSTTSIRI